MTLRHVFVSLAVTCLVACSSDDTIVSLNVAATDRVPVVEQLKVSFKQGSRSFVYNFKPPADKDDSIKNSFFQRITVPGDWEEAEAKISVEAFKAGGGSFDPALTDDTTVTINKDGVVAAYVKLDIPEVVPPPTEGGAGGEGAGGSASNGGAPPAGGAPTDAGGEANSGGTPSEAVDGGAGGGGGGAD